MSERTAMAPWRAVLADLAARMSRRKAEPVREEGSFLMTEQGEAILTTDGGRILVTGDPR